MKVNPYAPCRMSNALYIITIPIHLFVITNLEYVSKIRAIMVGVEITFGAR